MRLQIMLVGIVFSGLVFWGCIPERDQDKDAAGPPPKTQEELRVLLDPMMTPFRDSLQVGLPMPPPVRDDMLRQITQLKAMEGQSEDCQVVMRELGVEVKHMARTARDQELWELVRDYIDLYEILGMHSEVLAYIDEQAVVNMTRPKVRVSGFMENKEKGDLTVFISLLDRETGALTTTRRREGEEFEGLKVLKIIGNNDAVLFEYLPIEGLIFEVPAFEDHM